jgi:hypothetical protein
VIPIDVDYQLLLDTLPGDSPLVSSIPTALTKLRPRLELAQKAETEEMMNKLKGLGNTILGMCPAPCLGPALLSDLEIDSSGKFGMSTDNFKFTPNGQGGYSMSFVQ